MEELKLENHTWTIGDRIGGGGFGEVYEATSEDGDAAAAKLVPKDPGARRELLFVDLADVRNVVPVIDRGDTEDNWVLVMPRAECSLRERLEGPGLAQEDVMKVLQDVSAALADLAGEVVHRDLKPENVLLLDGAWCLADFGISRYAEATTAADTQKYKLTAAYAAPERWRLERATSATDVYALGVMAFELLTGELPFAGPSSDDFREQHLHQDAPPMEGGPVPLAALVGECLYKAPGARPTPANVAQRLASADAVPASGGLAKLAEANQLEVSKRAEESRKRSEEQTEAERRADLFATAEASYREIVGALREAILSVAPTARLRESGAGWTIELANATLAAASPAQVSRDAWDGREPKFDVIAQAEINLRTPPDPHEYEGRSHSLWFCDAQEPGGFAWFETAFMVTPLIPKRGRQDPFALPPGAESGGAIGPGAAEFQVAWPFARLTPGDLDDFVSRWAGWFGEAV